MPSLSQNSPRPALQIIREDPIILSVPPTLMISRVHLCHDLGIGNWDIQQPVGKSKIEAEELKAY